MPAARRGRRGPRVGQARPDEAFGDKPVEYRVSLLDSAVHEYVRLLTRPA